METENENGKEEKFVAEDIHPKRDGCLSPCFKEQLKEVGAERNLRNKTQLQT